MTRLGIIDRLQAGEVLIMDGATGSELQRRGINVNKGSVEGKLGVWSAACPSFSVSARSPSAALCMTETPSTP